MFFIIDSKNSVLESFEHAVWLIVLLLFKRVSFYILRIITLNLFIQWKYICIS